MTNIEILITLLSLTSFISALSIILSNNSAHSILFLTLFIFSNSLILFIYESELLGFLLNLIYLGAVAILFIFAIILIELRSEKTTSLNLKLLIFFYGLFLGFLWYTLNETFLIIFPLLDVNIEYNELNLLYSENIYYLNFENFVTIFSFAQTLYNYHLIIILLIGFGLLVGLVGAVVLVFDFSTILNTKKSSQKRKFILKQEYGIIYKKVLINNVWTLFQYDNDEYDDNFPSDDYDPTNNYDNSDSN